MYSLSSSKPPRQYSAHQASSSLNSSSNMNLFKQQTILLLKQQSDRIKQLTSSISTKDEQISIKNQQINFLRESITILQNENQKLIEDNNVLRVKLEKIVLQIETYNETVIKKIYQQNQKLKNNISQMQKKIKLLNDELIQANQEKNQINGTLQTKNTEIQNLNQIIKQQKVKNLQFQHQLSKQTNLTQKTQSQLLKCTNLLSNEEAKLEKNQFQLLTINKQLNNLINKHNSMIKQYQQKIRQVHSNKIDKSQVLVYENLVKSKQSQISKLSKSNQELIKKYQELRKVYLDMKQKMTKDISKLKLKLDEYHCDLNNLKKSFQLQRKIAQFESDKSQIFYAVYEMFDKIKNQNVEIKTNNQELQAKSQNMKMQIDRIYQTLNGVQMSKNLLKNQLQEQVQRLQSSYQGKLLTLNLKIRNQQQALERLKKNQFQVMNEYEKVYQDLKNTKIDFQQYKQVTSNSLDKLNKENAKLMTEMQELYKICQENVDNKRTVDKMKHVVHSLIIGLHYLQLKIIRSRQKQRKIYMPFVNQFNNLSKQYNKLKKDELDEQFKFEFSSMKKKSSSHLKQKKYNSSKLIKFKGCVWAVISIFRINRFLTENLKSSSINKLKLNGINFKIMKALNTRNKIPNNNQLLQKQAQIFLNKDNVQEVLNDLINLTKGVFMWPQRNFCKITLIN